MTRKEKRVCVIISWNGCKATFRSRVGYGPIHMDDDWPAYNDLTLDDSHWVWKFRPDHSNPDLIHMLLESPQPSYHEIVLPVDCVPKLACFDLEYWDTTMINVDPNDPVQALRTRMSQKYFHNVRTRISNTLSKGKHDAPLRHSLLVDIAHKWSIRTIKRFTHSPWGWESYEKHCEREGLVPYQQVLKHEDWKEHILTNATRYTSAENRGNMVYLTPFNNHHWMSAGDWLRSKDLLPFWHGISLEDVQRGLQDETWLKHREENAALLIESHKSANLAAMGRREYIAPKYLETFLPLHKIWSAALDILCEYCREDSKETAFLNPDMTRLMARSFRKPTDLDKFCHNIRKLNIPQKKRILLATEMSIPPNAPANHWVLILIDLRIGHLTIYDSWEPAYRKAENVDHWRHSGYVHQIEACQKWLDHEFKRRPGKVQLLQWSQWVIDITPEHMAFQQNAVDCGAYVMWFMWLFRTEITLEPFLGTNSTLIRSFRAAFVLDVLAHLLWSAEADVVI